MRSGEEVAEKRLKLEGKGKREGVRGRREESVAFIVHYELGSILAVYIHELICTQQTYEMGLVTTLSLHMRKLIYIVVKLLYLRSHSSKDSRRIQIQA